MAKKAKYYVVWQGYTPGIYNSWAECQLQIKGYPGAKYKAYPTMEQAQEAFAAGYQAPPASAPRKNSRVVNPDSDEIDWNSISVDAACSGNPGVLEYRGVHTGTREEIFHMGPFRSGTNNVGEFLALVHALALLDQKSDSTTLIYSDSKIAIGWVETGKARTKLVKTPANAQLFALLMRAEKWLRTHKALNPIEKWNTRGWGEIPADFGRK